MRAGVRVVAAAGGVVKATRDGMTDVSVRDTGPEAVAGREAGNGVLIEHGGGWQTQYSHLRSGSVSVEPGERVDTDDAFPAVVNEYVRTGRIKIDFRGLAFLGPDSLKALKIAMAAGLQNKLWQVVGLFYANQGAENSGWVTDSLIDQILAEVPGLDAAKVKVDAQSTKVANQIAAVRAEATKLEVQGTPWFYLAVGFNPPVNFQPRTLTPSEFRTPIDQALKAGSPDRGRIGALLVATALSLAIVTGVGASTSSPVPRSSTVSRSAAR